MTCVCVWHTRFSHYGENNFTLPGSSPVCLLFTVVKMPLIRARSTLKPLGGDKTYPPRHFPPQRRRPGPVSRRTIMSTISKVISPRSATFKLLKHSPVPIAPLRFRTLREIAKLTDYKTSIIIRGLIDNVRFSGVPAFPGRPCRINNTVEPLTLQHRFLHRTIGIRLTGRFSKRDLGTGAGRG